MTLLMTAHLFLFNIMTTFTFNRDLVLQSFAETEKEKEANKADYYKNREAGLKAYITVLKQQIKLGNGKHDTKNNIPSNR